MAQDNRHDMNPNQHQCLDPGNAREASEGHMRQRSDLREEAPPIVGTQRCSQRDKAEFAQQELSVGCLTDRQWGNDHPTRQQSAADEDERQRESGQA